MPLGRTLLGALASVLILPLGPDAMAQDAPATPVDAPYAGSRDAVLELLSFVPDTPAVWEGAPVISYLDMAAMVDAAYAGLVPDSAMGVLPADDVLRAMFRAQAGPQRYMQHLYRVADEMPALLGIGMADVHRGLDYGTPPRNGMVLGLDPAADRSAAVAAALEGRGFALREVSGMPVWHRWDDGEMRLDERNPADPFGGDLGQAARIVVTPGALAGSPQWSVTQAAAAAIAGEMPALTGNPAVRTAVSAVTGSADDATDGGRLLQLMLLNARDTMAAPPNLLDMLESGVPAEDAAPVYGPDLALPPYLLVALADRRVGERDQAVVALVYPDVGQAETAAGRLSKRLFTFAPATAPDAWSTLLADREAEVTSGVVTDADSGLAAAIVRISSPTVTPAEDPDEWNRLGGSEFRFLVNAVYRRELTPLMVFE